MSNKSTASSVNVLSAMQKITNFVQQNILTEDIELENLETPVLFVPREQDTMNNVFDLVQSEYPSLLRSRLYFISLINQTYISRFGETD